MIKNLKNKMFISLFILVAVFSVTSSCFAFTNFVSSNIASSPYTLEEVNQLLIDNGYSSWVNYNKVIYKYSTTSFRVVVFNNSNISYIAETPDATNYVYFYDSLGNKITTDYIELRMFNGSFDKVSSMTSRNNYLFPTYDTWILYYSNYDIYDSVGNLFYTADSLKSVDVIHEFQNDTSAKVTFDYSSYGSDCVLKYSLSGIDLNSDLNEPIQLRNPVIYTPGVSNLVVKSNTKVYWALYDSSGECLESDVYQVPEYDVQVENSDKSIEYSVSYNEDYTLATLNVNVINGEFSDKLYYTENGMVSNDYAGKQLFPASKSLQIDHNCNMHIILYDPFDNLITAKYVTINKIGLIPEENFKVDVTTGDKTVYVRPRLYNVLQSNFYNIEYDVKLDSWTSSQDIKLFQNGVFVSNVTESTSSYSCGSDSELKFYQNIGTSNITVTFRIINAETGFTCLTRTVSFKIGLDNDSTGVTDSTTNGITDNSFITGNGESNYSGVANMGIDDYYNLVNTNNTAWSFFKIILNSLPNWITLPLSLLIFGVVIITLYRFIRGA